MVTNSTEEEMLGSKKLEKISIIIAQKQSLDHTRVEDMFSKLATDDEVERVNVIKDIQNDIKEMAYAELDSVKLFLSTILRLSQRSPYPDITSGMTDLLHQLEGLGLQIPRIRIKKGPSFYIPQHLVPKLDDTESDVYQLFKEAFLNDARISHMVQIMGFHPKYLKHWVQTHHYILRGPGQLPKHIRAYIGILASCRHHCLYSVNLLEREFLCFGGPSDWLQGIQHAPRKIQNLATVNNILCHQPWNLQASHMQELLTGPDSWSKQELSQALTIICHFHALTQFILGCGLTHEIDSSAGHTYGSSGCCTPIKVFSSSPLDTPSDDESSGSEKNGYPILFDDIYTRLLEEEREPINSELNYQHFADLLEQQANTELYQSRRSSALSHYIVNPDYTYSVCKEMTHGHDFDWDEMGFPIFRHYNTELADILDAKFKIIQRLTYKTMGQKENIDTTKLRESVWYFTQQLLGVYYTDFDYGLIKCKLPDNFKDYIRVTVSTPGKLQEETFRFTGFTDSEKVHFSLIMMESRFQATFCFALKALN